MTDAAKGRVVDEIVRDHTLVARPKGGYGDIQLHGTKTCKIGKQGRELL